MRNIWLLMVLMTAIVVAACSTTTTATPTLAPASTGATPTATAGVSSSPSGAPSASAPASPTSGPSASAGACASEAPTAMSSTWNTVESHGDDYTFKFPTAWDKLYGSPPFNTSSLLDPQTLAETGLPANSKTLADVVRTPSVEIPSATVLVVPGVVSSTQVVFDRQVKGFQANPNVSNLDATLTGCIGGEPMLGVELLFNKGGDLSAELVPRSKRPFV